MRTPNGLKIDNPAWPLLQAQITYWGIATGGNVLGTTVLCADLVNEPSYQGLPVKLLDGNAAGQVRLIAVHVAGANVITVSAPFTDNAGAVVQVVPGTRFVILSVPGGGQLFTMDFWSEGLEEVQIGDGVAGATVALPDLTVAGLPAGATIVRAIVMFKFRMIENTNAAGNRLNGATVALTSQVIQIRSDAPTAYVDAINFVDDYFTLAATTREGGDVQVGQVNVAATVDENDTYELRWLLARADLDFINFNDCQVGLRIWYSV